MMYWPPKPHAKQARQLREPAGDRRVKTGNQLACYRDAHERGDHAFRGGLDVGEAVCALVSSVMLEDEVATVAHQQAVKLREICRRSARSREISLRGGVKNNRK